MPETFAVDSVFEIPEDAVNIDTEADAFARPVPPPDGIHTATLELRRGPDAPAGFVYAKGADHGLLVALIQATVVAPGEYYHGSKVFDRVTSFVSKVSGTSRMASLIRLLGGRLSARMSLRDMAEQLQELLAAKPLIRIETRWEARHQAADGEWETVLRGMKRFPRRQDPETGQVGHYHYVTVEGERVYADASIVRYLQME